MWGRRARRDYGPDQADEGQTQDILGQGWVCDQAWATVGQLVVYVGS